MSLHYVQGDATYPVGGPRKKILAHVCNDSGGWGRGFVLAVSKRWPEPERSYRAWKLLSSCEPFSLGSVQFVRVDDPAYNVLTVANMVAQHAYGGDGEPPIRYDALETCLAKVGHKARSTKRSVHMPRIGCGLAGGSWVEVEPILGRTMKDVEVFVYDLPKEEAR
jgi:O-acetyl-ADP-ribose deacetylase (regulator of RNase III)